MIHVTTIKEYAYTLGFDSVRITGADAFPEAEGIIKERIAQGLMDGLPWFTAERSEVSCHPDALLPEAQSIITLAMVYLSEQPEPSVPSEPQNDTLPRGRISRYAWGDDYHEVMKSKLYRYAEWLRDYARDEAGDAVETRVFVDTGRMVDRAVAQRAGLGWYGKNTNILTKEWGSWVFLAEIVTNLPLSADTPIKTSCGSCEICLHACPTQALPAPYVLDTPRCISFLTIELRGTIPVELRPLMGNLIFGCDICQEVCPVNIITEKRLGLRGTSASASARAKPVAFHPHTEFRPRASVGSNAELIPLLSLTEEQFRERFRASPIRRTKRRGLLRNVCVALGNSGDSRALPALCIALHDSEPLIRGHAAWAVGRIGGEQAHLALNIALADEQDTEVRKEIHYALSMF